MIKNDTNAPAAAIFYKALLADSKKRIRQAQNRAAMSVNAEMIRLYWDIGDMVAKRQELKGWGKGLLRRLAADIKDEIPEITGFSERNLQLMIQFQREYPDFPKLAEVAERKFRRRYTSRKVGK